MDEVVTTKAVTNGELQTCGEFARVFAILGKRWTGLVLDLLIKRPARFCELASAIPGISDRVLTERLRELEHEGFVDRLVSVGPPIAVTYSLSERGQHLRGVVGAIHEWAAADRAWLDAAAAGKRRSTGGRASERASIGAASR